MKKSIVILLALLLFCCNCSSAQVIAVDPNTPSAAAVEQKVDDSGTDERLAQKVTYTATGKRLHTVLDELSAMTGVAIRCGSGDKDWQTRDLPVIVCCKDMPLANLLKAIAESTHLLLSSYSVGDVRGYRIWQDKTRKKMLEDFYKTAREAGLANASMEWDSWIKLASVPESELIDGYCESDDEESRSHVQQVSRFSKVMAKLGPDAKKKVFSGEPLCISVKDANPDLADAMTEIYRTEWESDRKRHEKYRNENPEDYPEGFADMLFKDLTDEDLQHVCLSISLTKDVYPELSSSVDGSTTSFSLYDMGPQDYSDAVADLPELPEYPLSDYIRSMRKVGWDSWDESEFTAESEDVTEPEDVVEIKLQKPKGKEDIVFADVVKAATDAGGYAIICEDFLSHKDDHDQYEDLFNEETDFDQVLTELGWSSTDNMNWYVDDQNKLVVGYAEKWYERHEGLVPESLVNSLRDKLNGDGLELDDVLPVLRLTPRQISDWFGYDTELSPMQSIGLIEGKSLWMFYASLSKQDRKQAMSNAGLPLGKFDSKVVCDVLSRASDFGDWEDPDYGMMGSCCRDYEMETYDIPTDPETVSKLTLHVCGGDFKSVMMAQVENDPEMKEELAQMGVDLEQYMSQIAEAFMGNFPEGMGAEMEQQVKAEMEKQMRKKVYYMQLKGEGIDQSLAFFGDGFPIYSEEREKQLDEERKKGDAMTRPTGQAGGEQ